MVDFSVKPPFPNDNGIFFNLPTIQETAAFLKDFATGKSPGLNDVPNLLSPQEGIVAGITDAGPAIGLQVDRVIPNDYFNIAGIAGIYADPDGPFLGGDIDLNRILEGGNYLNVGINGKLGPGHAELRAGAQAFWGNIDIEEGDWGILSAKAGIKAAFETNYSDMEGKIKGGFGLTFGQQGNPLNAFAEVTGIHGLQEKSIQGAAGFGLNLGEAFNTAGIPSPEVFKNALEILDPKLEVGGEITTMNQTITPVAKLAVGMHF